MQPLNLCFVNNKVMLFIFQVQQKVKNHTDILFFVKNAIPTPTD